MSEPASSSYSPPQPHRAGLRQVQNSAGKAGARSYEAISDACGKILKDALRLLRGGGGLSFAHLEDLEFVAQSQAVKTAVVR